MFNQVHTFTCDNLFIYSCTNFHHLKVVCQLGVAQLLLHNSFFLLQMNVLVEIPFPSSNIDFQWQHTWYGTLKFVLKISFWDMSSYLHITMTFTNIKQMPSTHQACVSQDIVFSSSFIHVNY
jgi:hypothetical protein